MSAPMLRCRHRRLDCYRVQRFGSRVGLALHGANEMATVGVEQPEYW